MNWRKIESFLNSKLGICILTGVLMFGAGKAAGLQDHFVENRQIIEEQKNKIDELQSKIDEKEKQEEENHSKIEKDQKENEAEDKVLSSGNYESGKDFEPGTYDIVAISGGGNVYSSNSHRGGINTILGSDKKIAEAESVGMGDMYKKEYKNVELPKGAKLKIDGVEVKLVTKN